MTGLLSQLSHEVMIKKLQILAKEYADLQRQDAKLPYDKKDNIGLLLALRPWEFEVFKPLYRR